MIKSIFGFLVLPFLFISVLSCEDIDSDSKTEFGIFTVIDQNTVNMDGVITSSTLDDFDELIDFYPEIDLINMIEVPGSDDDEINLEVSAAVHDRDIATHLMDGGLIASGGVDFFLAGTTRTKGNNTMIGVHSWSDGTNEATDFPVGDAVHLPYINYYIYVGLTPTEAEAFYYFSINAAPAVDIHYMTEDEIETYNLLKP